MTTGTDADAISASYAEGVRDERAEGEREAGILRDTLAESEKLRAAALTRPAEQREVADLREWIISLWDSEVANRPLVNRYRRILDDVYRNVYRHISGGEELPRPRADEKEIQKALAALTSPAEQQGMDDLRRKLEEAVSEKQVAWDRMAVHNKDADDAVARAEAREAALVKALEWYAIPGHYVSSSLYMGGGQGPTMADTDGGQRARAALAVKEGK